jgi:hypothetical protein
MLFACLEFLLGAGAFTYLFLENRIWTKKGGWFTIIFTSLLLSYYIYAFFRNLWKKSHQKNHVYVDCGPEGICIDTKPSLDNSRPVFYRWEEIEYVNFCADLLEFFLLVKPYKKRKVLYKFNYWRWEFTYFWGFRKAILEFSGRKDCIKKKYPRSAE